MKIRQYTKKGMLVLALGVGLLVIFIVFVSITNRMRSEAVLTNRVSINERLNQLASAVGRIAIRKLQNDIEIKEEQDIYNYIFTNNPPSSSEKVGRKDYTSVLLNGRPSFLNSSMLVIKDISTEFAKTFGEHGKLSPFKVEFYFTICDKFDSSEGINGFSNENSNTYDRKGFTNVEVTLGYGDKIKRKYTVRKEFKVARLLAPPFHRFTLFVRDGANIDDDIANAIQCEYTGKLVNADKKPLVCINRIFNKNYNGSNASFNLATTESNFLARCTEPTGLFGNDANKFIKNGWIYLGGSGKSTDRLGKSGNLMLNITSGDLETAHDDNMKTYFPETFHFYNDNDNQGWARLEDWTNFVKQKMGSVEDEMRPEVTTVSTGLFNKMGQVPWDGSRPPDDGENALIDGYFLFPEVERDYKSAISKKIYGDTSRWSNIPFSIDNCSSLHLFGTPKRCTPTLIFGPVKRRYMLCFGLLTAGYVMPLRSINYSDSEDYVMTKIFGEFHTWYLEACFPALKGREAGEEDLSLLSSLSDFLVQTFAPTSTSPAEHANDYYGGYRQFNLCGLAPRIKDDEPYILALKNLASPQDSSKSWQQVMGGMTNNSFCKTLGDCDNMCKSDFEFTTDDMAAESGFKGRLSDLSIDYNEYLRKKSTYTFKVPQGEKLKISDQFFQDHFFEEIGGKKQFILNQIIRVEGDLEIDEELYCARGGVIVCTGEIEVKKPILNMFLEKRDATNSDNFGYLTLVAKKGIVIKVNDEFPQDEEEISPLQRIEAFLVAGCGDDTSSSEVKVDKPLHIIGGVAADKITDILNKGCIIEWGFDPSDKFYGEDSKYLYGMTLGPRDIEIYSGE